jgi:hypothetical protein
MCGNLSPLCLDMGDAQLKESFDMKKKTKQPLMHHDTLWHALMLIGTS